VSAGGRWFRWLTGDEAGGRDGAWLDGMAALGRWSVAEGPHDTPVWLVLRRGWGENPALQVSLRNAPAPTLGTAPVRVAGRRWPIETAFEERQGGRGLNHDDIRSGLGWPHHLPRWLLAHHVLGRACQRGTRGRRPYPVGRRCAASPPSGPSSRSRHRRPWTVCGRSSRLTTRPSGPTASASSNDDRACHKVTL
jgi:hypothetical protein